MSNHDFQKDKTKNKIKTAFLSLLRENSYNGITISSICSRAQIHRSTFYSHYENKEMIIDDLLNDCNQFHIELFPSISCMSKLEQSCFWLEMIKKSEIIAPIFMSVKDLTKITGFFENSKEIDESMKKTALAFLSNHKIHLDEKQANSMFSKIVEAVIIQWISSDFEIPTAEIARLICSLIGIDEVADS